MKTNKKMLRMPFKPFWISLSFLRMKSESSLMVSQGFGKSSGALDQYFKKRRRKKQRRRMRMSR